jgi:hypothetical protein
MEIVGLLGWWYGAGWKQTVHRRIDGLASTADLFSIGLLARTLFAPYRQIAAGRVRGPFAIQMHAFFDRLFSRVIGAVIRLVMMIIGILVLAVQAILACGICIVWGIVPFLPIVGAVIAFIGWIPQWK